MASSFLSRRAAPKAGASNSIFRTVKNSSRLAHTPRLFLKEAREAGIAAKKQLSGGVAPSAEKKLRAKSLQTTFEAMAREWHSNQTAIWTENYARDVVEQIAKNIFPYLGNRPIAEITPPELLAVLRKIEIRGAVDQAHRVQPVRRDHRCPGREWDRPGSRGAFGKGNAPRGDDSWGKL